jgi:outer membrane protein OmpA-like peptidoglycan-associated protein
MFGSLLSSLDKGTTGQVAQALGQPEQSVARGMESSIAALLGGLASKSEDTGALRRILDTVSGASEPISWSQIASGVTDPNSSLMSMGSRILPVLFGGSEKTVTGALGRESGLPSGAISSLLAMAAPVVMSFISKRVRDSGMTMSSLGALLQRESATIRSALPSGLTDLFWPGAATVGTVSPVVAQAVQKEPSHSWAPVLAIAALGLGLLWFLGHARRPTVIVPVVPSTAVGTANRLATPPVSKPVCAVPANVVLPPNGAASQLLTIIQTPDAKARQDNWITIDRLTFNTGSAKLMPQSERQIGNIATVLSNCPAVHLNIAGFTDNLGSPEANLNLSRNRAKAVVAELVKKGVSPDRLSAQGYGEDNPVADNSTAEGRAQNRRAAMAVTGK